jgi:hypothetical protein
MIYLFKNTDRRRQSPPIGENSPNLVTLFGIKIDFRKISLRSIYNTKPSKLANFKSQFCNAESRKV